MDTHPLVARGITLTAAFRGVLLVLCRPTEEYPLSSNIVTTFLELGDATSQNLGFSYGEDVSYGEETITEHNLLEIRRRHRDRVHLETFSKAKEAKSGADWEWHIVGHKWTLKMRVQAKRVQCDGRLKIKYKQQREVLLDRAKDDNMRSLYCIYCTEPQRSLWTQSHPMDDFEGYQTGCLLADANDVPVTTTKPGKIEHKCIPWHYLFERAAFVRKHKRIGDRAVSLVISDIESLRVDDLGDDGKGQSPEGGWKAPTIADLNGEGDDDFDHTGVHATNGEDLERFSSAREEGTDLGQENQAEIWDRGIHLMLVIDVRPER